MRVTNAMIHSIDDIGEVEVLEWNSDNDITVRTKQGVVCKAIFNPFVGRIYADDLYAVLDNYKESYREGCNTFNRKRKKKLKENDSAKDEFDFTRLDKIATDLYNSHNDEGFLDFSNDELAVLWAYCMLSAENPYGRSYDDEVYEAIREKEDQGEVEKEEIFIKAHKIWNDLFTPLTFKSKEGTSEWEKETDEWADGLKKAMGLSDYMPDYKGYYIKKESFNRKRLKEMLFFKPMSKEDAKKFYDLLKQEKPSPFIRNCLDNLTFFTDNFSKDYGNYDPKENYEKAPLPERFLAKGLSEGTKKTKSGKWINKGKSGKDHGKFSTKKKADEQRKAMFAQGWKPKGVKEAFQIGNGDYQTVKVYNPYNYTIQELRINNRDKTFERGNFTMGKPDKKLKNKQEYEDVVDELVDMGYTEIPSDYRSLRNKTRKGIPTSESKIPYKKNHLKERNLTRAERHNRDADRIFGYKRGLDQYAKKFLGDKGYSAEDIKKFYDNDDLGGEITRKFGKDIWGEVVHNFSKDYQRNESVSRKKIKESRDYAKEDEDKEKIMDWLLDADKVQAMWDWFYADEEGNDADEILSTLADEYIEANGGYDATDKTYRSFEGDGQFGLRDKESNGLLYSSESSGDAWEDELTRMGEQNREYIKDLLKKVINLYAFYNFNREDLGESKLPTRGKKMLKERWEYTLNSGRSLRQAIKSGDPQEVLRKLKKAYDELERKDLISQSDLLDVMEEITDAEEEPSQERVDELLDELYDFCDLNRIWVGV